MPLTDNAQERFRRSFLLVLVLGISVVFLLMIRGFLTAILLAGIFSAMAQPLYRWIRRRTGGREGVASALTVLVVIVLIVGPITAFLTVVVGQAIQVSQSVGPWVEQQLQQPDQLNRLLQRIPFAEHVQPYQDQILSKVGELAGTTGGFLVSKVAAASRMTVTFLLNLFVMLYAMFFFLTGGTRILERMLYYMPLDSTDERRMVERFVAVTRATLKGTLVIGTIQGALAGAAFAVAGIGGAAFWGTVMTVLSIVPGIGAAFVWIPAVVFLVVTGHTTAGVLLAIWCGVVVGTVDNVLRPRLVGKGARMSDLMILVSTLGGIMLFGAVGFIIGPIVAALFVTVWDIYGVAFRDLLPEVLPLSAYTSSMAVPEPIGAVSAPIPTEPPSDDGPAGSDDQSPGDGGQETVSRDEEGEG